MNLDVIKQDEARRLRHCRSEALANWELAKARALATQPTTHVQRAQYEAHARQVLTTLRARRRPWAWLRRLLGH